MDGKKIPTIIVKQSWLLKDSNYIYKILKNDISSCLYTYTYAKSELHYDSFSKDIFSQLIKLFKINQTLSLVPQRNRNELIFFS